MRKIIPSLFILVLMFSSCDFFKSKNLFSNNEDSLIQYKKKQDSLMFVDSIQKLQDKLSTLRQKRQRILDSIKSTKSETVSNSNHKYHIIVGGFRNPNYLRSYQQHIQGKGFNPKILENEQGFKLIAVESFNKWSSTVSTLENIRNNVERNAWIYDSNGRSAEITGSIPSSPPPQLTKSSSSTSSSSESSSSNSSSGEATTSTSSSGESSSSLQNTDSNSSTNSKGSEKWDKILDSYEAYIDQYIKLQEKAQNGDMDAMSEYAEMMKKARDLDKKLENADDELSTNQMKRFSELQTKLANAAASTSGF